MKYSTACHNRNKIFRHRTEVPKLQTARRDMFAASNQQAGYSEKREPRIHSVCQPTEEIADG